MNKIIIITLLSVLLLVLAYIFNLHFYLLFIAGAALITHFLSKIFTAAQKGAHFN